MGDSHTSNQIFTPGPTSRTVRAANGKVLSVPEGWSLLAPGDAALTRRVKAAGEHWVVAEKKRGRVFSRGVTRHATPVGSGTVARTKRIPVERRAEAAVIAWMRHQTTGYDGMAIPRVKGKRREVRRMLAQQSKKLLARYRGAETGRGECPLAKVLANGRKA